MEVDLIIHNLSELVTCRSDGPKRGAEMLDAGVIRNGAVAIRDGIIAAAGPGDEILNEHQAAQTFDARGSCAVPGFVDPHTHIVFGGDRLDEFEMRIRGAEYLEILEAGGGILSTVQRTREATIDQLVGEAAERLERMLACGTTTCEVKTGYGLSIHSEVKSLRVIEALDTTQPVELVPTLLAAHAMPMEFRGDPEGYVDLICKEILPRAWDWYDDSHFRPRKVPFFVDVFCEQSAFSLDQSRRVLQAGAALGFGAKAHVDQFSNIGGSRMALELKAASIDHLDTISDEEVSMLADSDTVGVVIPTENFSAGKTAFADARRLIDSGCIVAISTDYNPGSAPCPSQPMAMAIASRYQKLLPAECLNAATINAAYAVGLGETHGSIEAGKVADIAVFDTADHRALVYEFGGWRAERVYKRGKAVHGHN